MPRGQAKTPPPNYTAAQIQERFKWGSRQMVSAAATRYGWRYLEGTWPRAYLAKDVDNYTRRRMRGELQRELGTPTRELVTTTIYDRTCPECAGIACYRRAMTYNEKMTWRQKASEGLWPWRCENGHHGGEG